MLPLILIIRTLNCFLQVLIRYLALQNTPKITPPPPPLSLRQRWTRITENSNSHYCLLIILFHVSRLVIVITESSGKPSTLRSSFSFHPGFFKLYFQKEYLATLPYDFQLCFTCVACLRVWYYTKLCNVSFRELIVEKTQTLVLVCYLPWILKPQKWYAWNVFV